MNPKIIETIREKDLVKLYSKTIHACYLHHRSHCNDMRRKDPPVYSKWKHARRLCEKCTAFEWFTKVDLFFEEANSIMQKHFVGLGEFNKLIVEINIEMCYGSSLFHVLKQILLTFQGMIVQPHDDKDLIFADYIHNCNDVNLCGLEKNHGFMKKCFPNHILFN